VGYLADKRRRRVSEWRPHTQTLAAFVKSLPSKKGIEKNLLAQKFIKSIKYCKESIELNLFLSPAENKKIASEGGEISVNSVRNNKNGCSFRLSSNHIIPIILPNTIHQCRKKNL